MASSCDDVLVEVPKNFISAGNFYTNTKEVEDGLNGAYYTLWSQIDGNAWKNFHALFTEYGTAAGSFASVGNWDKPLQPDTYSRLNGFWLGFYRLIDRANIILGKAPLVENMNENTRRRILGEAHFLRAYAYFALVRYWGPVPIRTEQFTGASELAIPRAPKDQVYDLIIEDLLIAEQDCPEDVGNNTLRGSKWAAKLMLAEVYLDMEDWANAAAKANEVIESNHYSLVTVEKPDDFYKIFAVTSTCSEEIWAFHFSLTILPTFMQWYHGVGTPYNRGVTYGFTNYPRMNSSFIVNWDKNDLRYDFNLYSSYNTAWPDEGGQIVNLTGVQSTRFKKYIKNPAGDALYNVPIYRLADAFLIYAEASCMSAGSPSTLGLERLNIIKRRAYGFDPYSPSSIDYTSGMSRDEFRDAVIKERGYEFFNEYSRWWDLKRTGKAKELIGAAVGKVVNDARLLFPLPLVEIETNPAIGPSNQNPGY